MKIKIMAKRGVAALLVVVFVLSLALMTREPITAYATGTVYFMSADGDDANDGLTLDTAWETFQRAQRTLQAGDTLLVSSQGGPFTRPDRFASQAGGTASAPITIRALGNERPIINSQPLGSYSVFFDVFHNHFHIEGLSFIDVGYGGNSVMRIQGDHVNIINNVFDNQLNTDYGRNPSRWSNHHLVVWAADYITLRGNYFNGAGHSLVRDAASPNANGAVDMVQFQGSRNVLIEHNYFGNAGHAALAFDCLVSNFNNNHHSPPRTQGRSAGNLVVQFNVFSNAWGGGFYVGRSFGNAAPNAPLDVRMDGLRPGHEPGDGGAPGGFVIQNNIMFNYGSQCDYPKSGFTVYANEGHIIRHNIIAYGDDYFGSQSSALGFTAFNGGFGATNSPRRHRIYNNITFRNGGPAVYIAEGNNATARDVVYKNNIFFEDNSPNWAHNRMYGGGQAQIMLVAHNTNPIPATHLPQGALPGRTFQDCFNENFPGSLRFINNMIQAPDGRSVEVQFWSPAGFRESLDFVQNRFPLAARNIVGSPGILGGFAGNIEADPMFVSVPYRAPRPFPNQSFHGDPVDFAHVTGVPGIPREERNVLSYNFRLQPDSPAIDAGANLTTTTASGTNTTIIPVVDALFFTCGVGLIPGDPIIVGDNEIVRVVAVDHRGRTLTVNRAITFNNGDAVNLPFNGANPDIGAFMFTETPESLIDTVGTNGGYTEILGVITSDSGQNVMLRVTSGGSTVYINQTTSGNSGSFRFLVPLTGSGYTFTVTGHDATPVTFTR